MDGTNPLQEEQEIVLVNFNACFVGQANRRLVVRASQDMFAIRFPGILGFNLLQPNTR